ncbi:MaoC family dehydratase N-terminal domain-containing protein [Neobacillus niacini]|uniref:FAS1-like dehydratase domain-containing protein n=1 Tax=Neobacillus niacini TaxID=86668 RepID=UPI0030002735
MKEEFTHYYQSFEIERGKIKSFAKVLGLKNPIYYDKEEAQRMGYRDVVAPPTFPTVIDFCNDNDFYQLFSRLHLNPEKVLHGEQSYEYLEPICAGDTITGTVTLERMDEKRNMKFYHLKTIYRNQFKQISVISNSTLIQIP